MRTIVLAAALAACSCGGASPPSKPPAQAAKPAPDRPPQPTKPSFPGVPATPVGDQLAWVLDAIVARHGKVDRAEVEAHFHSSFLAEVPSDQTVQIFGQLAGQLTSLAITDVKAVEDRLAAHATSGDAKLQISIALDPVSKKIAGLLFQPDVDRGAKPQSFDEALRSLAAMGAKAQLLVAALDKGTCKPLQELATTEQLAIGSTFKLYVLLALADRVLAGKAAWTDELAVRDDWKSLPSGTTQNEPPGTKHPLAMYAERMISISDNTAADHLIYTLGRKAVEAAVRAAKHARPALDAPFLSTRELFVFRLGLPAPEIERYLKLSEAKRREYLDKTLAGKDPNIGLSGAWKTARQIDKIEWFASSMDLCRTMAALWTRAQNPKAAVVLDILGKNPGLPLDKERWPYIGYKGGSEPGVFNMTYLLRRADDRWFVITLSVNAAEGGALEDAKIAQIAAGIVDLVAAAPD